MTSDADELLTDDDPELKERLRELRQDGCNLLMTGEPPSKHVAETTAWFLGRAERRYRILALSAISGQRAVDNLPDDTSVADPNTWVIDQRNGERSAPCDATGLTSDLADPEMRNFPQIRDEVLRAIDFYEEKAGGFEPAQLRLGIDSIYVATHIEERDNTANLRDICERVKDACGMAHYHLRCEDDHELVDELMSLFDARVEVRRMFGRPLEHRWHFPDAGKLTPWWEL